MFGYFWVFWVLYRIDIVSISSRYRIDIVSIHIAQPFVCHFLTHATVALLGLLIIFHVGKRQKNLNTNLKNLCIFSEIILSPNNLTESHHELKNICFVLIHTKSQLCSFLRSLDIADSLLYINWVLLGYFYGNYMQTVRLAISQLLFCLSS